MELAASDGFWKAVDNQATQNRNDIKELVGWITRDEVTEPVLLCRLDCTTEIWCVARNDLGKISLYLSNWRSDVENYFDGAGNRILMSMGDDGHPEEVDHNWVCWTRNEETAKAAHRTLQLIDGARQENSSRPRVSEPHRPAGRRHNSKDSDGSKGKGGGHRNSSRESDGS